MLAPKRLQELRGPSSGNLIKDSNKNAQLRLKAVALSNLLPPPPDEDDDMLSHYDSPKYDYDGLPLRLFTRPDPVQERFEASCFPCFKYYDLTKYSLQEARQLSAMDIIPKEALKNVEEQPHRTKRVKRATAESAGVAGYYRYKNEGVEVLYGRDSNKTDITAKSSGRLKKAAATNPDKTGNGTAPVIFRSILDPERFGAPPSNPTKSSHIITSALSQPPRPQKSPSIDQEAAAPLPPKRKHTGPIPLTEAQQEEVDRIYRRMAPSLGKKPPPAQVPILPRKQGNRLDFIANLRQGYTPEMMAGRPASAPTEKRMTTGTGATTSKPASLLPPKLKAVDPVYTPPAALRPLPKKLSVPPSGNLPPKKKKLAPNPVAAQQRSSRPELDTSSSMDEERMGAEALGVMAHEELGASDDEGPGMFW